MEKIIIPKEFIEQYYERLIHIHEKIIKETEGEQGVRDEGGLYHSIYKIARYQAVNKYDPSKVGALIYKELARKHHFFDGNKRTAHVYAKLAIFLMNFHFKLDYEEALPKLLRIAKYKSDMSFNDIKNWIGSHIEKIPPMNRENYLKIIMYDLLTWQKKKK